MPVDNSGSARHYGGPEAAISQAEAARLQPTPRPAPAPPGRVFAPAAPPPARPVMNLPPAVELEIPALQGDEAAAAQYADSLGRTIYTGEDVYKAFLAGIAFIRAQIGQTADRVQEEQLQGTATSRTLIAALEVFADQMLSHRPEEVAKGEWLSAEQVRELIAEIQRVGDLRSIAW